MTEQKSPLARYYKPGWENYQQALVKTISALSSEQLGLPVVPNSFSIGEHLAKMIGARVNWFFAWMGEGGDTMAALDRWAGSENSVMPGTAELVTMFEETWRVISSALDRWTATDLEQPVSPPASQREWRLNHGLEEDPPRTREWIVWYVMENEIHRGGELSLALGTYGIESFYTG